MGNINRPELFDEETAARYIDMSVAFLRSGRQRGVVGNHTPPPAHLQLGRTIRYDRRDLDKWLDARRVDPAARRRVVRAVATRDAAPPGLPVTEEGTVK
jgi:hypothetical protein